MANVKKSCQYCQDTIRGDKITVFGFGRKYSYIDWGCFLLMGTKGLLKLAKGRLTYKHRK